MPAQAGDRVKVHYTGTLSDGEVFDSSTSQDPLEFELGTGTVIAGFEEAVLGLSASATRTVTIPADQAYGPRQEELVLKVERSSLPTDVELTTGQWMELQREDGQHMTVQVTEVTDTILTLDANHALAGQDLTFDLELVEIIENTDRGDAQ